MKRVYPLLRRKRMTRNRLLKAMGEGYWVWPVRHLKKFGKKLAQKRQRQAAKRNREE